ncbi:receptor-like protein kinase 5 [Cornus florida]|uniref:receptor-like protein kinase 5 n=1 Tax=Cornus florida TaxID=4283 RepID=UPI00289CE1F6|nr:receptor-like protein kinase 5 [Cornus florida]
MSKISPTFLQITLTLLIFTLPSHGNTQTITDPEQAILLKLKQHWSNPPSIEHWNSTSSHCTWPEITCISGSVTELSLIDKNISGIIPPFICDLQNLTLLVLQYNNIPGPFPTVLYNCSKLQTLDISQNYFVGSIPSDIHRLSSQLRELNIAYNNFTGDIPASIGRFSELRTLNIELNLFNGTFPPEIGNLWNLELLWMAVNPFAPSKIPSNFTQLRKLKSLWMSSANLIGEIPEAIGNMTALELLDVSTNQLTGNIPNGVFLLKNLTTLHLHKNKLSGEIPTSVEAFNLDVVDLSENKLTGTIPDDFGKLTKLTGLALFTNHLSGEVPQSIGRFAGLQVIKLFGNNLSGQLPPDLGRYSMLRDFQVGNNQFTGQLPEYICANGVLVGLMAMYNNLTGELPSSLGNCMSLLYIRVHGNRLSGEIPAGLWASLNLTQLIIRDNLFTGHLPDKLPRNLTRFEISNNQLSGEIPAGISSLRNLTVFTASNNLFTGTIPQDLNLPFLTTLSLDRNRLSGHFPSEIVSWKSLNTLNLSRNQLSGNIPAEIGSLPVLTSLDLSDNQFSGQIPPEFGKLTLNSLNLSSNSLTGRIPGKYEIAFFDASFLNNPGLCSSKPSLGIEVCSSGARKSGRISTQLFATLISVASVLFVLAIIFTFFVIKVHPKRKLGLDLTWKLTSFQRLNFTVSSILSRLTENCMIGSGGSGKVYRVPVNSSEDEFVAVKRIWNNRKLDQKLEKQFLAEVEILGTIRHSNIVKLLCCMSNETSKLLVYEFLENGSLHDWLHGNNRPRQPSVSGSVHHVVLDWPKRFQIAVGAAQGLCYMHNDCSPPIVHRDLKSSNILLDPEFNAKIADFGLAKMLIKHGEPNTVSAVAGSIGYIAPEYALTSRVNEKIDVYSFGVVLLELATGKKASEGDEEMGLAGWAWHQLQEGKSIEDALDEEIKEPCYLEEMCGVFKLGINCTFTLPSTRPTMKEVLQILLRYKRGMAFQENNGGGEYDAAPLLKNSKRERRLETDDDDLASNV